MPLIKNKKEKSNDWKWWFKDYPKEKNGLNVFSCFACAGGSTMGYKLAGCSVIGCLEIDKRMNDVYVANHNPQYNYLMDIREFNKIPNEELPKKLLNLDILDGSPPCTTFSMAGKREKTWGQKKKFAEGQTEQILDELIFEFAETVNKLKPKVVIMENVKGLIVGNAIQYYNKYLNKLKSYGYQSKGYLLKGEEMGVPQKRHRVFVISVRNDIVFNFNELNLRFNYEEVLFRDIKIDFKEINKDTITYKVLACATEYDRSISSVLYGGSQYGVGYARVINWDDSVASTLSTSGYYDGDNRAEVGWKSIRNISTFSQDFDFKGSNVQFICGMSVPPIMIKRIVTRLLETNLFKENKNND